MKIFKNLGEMKPYYNEKTKTYEFIENRFHIDIVIDFELDINSNIRARNINAKDIQAGDINAWDIKARDIKSCDIKAGDINAGDIQAENINSNNIQYNSVCYARSKFVCNSIKGIRPNSKHFCLDSEIVINCVD